MHPKPFITQVLLAEIQNVVYKDKYHYLSFCLISSGIEFLGKCIDPNAGWHDFKANGFHFKLAISSLMPKYRKHAGMLYKSLRCGFAHGLVPDAPVGLTHRAEARKENTTHLTWHRQRFVLVVEELYDDFAEACRSVIARKYLPGDKMNKPLLTIP